MIKVMAILLLVPMMAGAIWILTEYITLPYNQWTQVGSAWQAAGLPNIKPVMCDVPGLGLKVCTEISWSYTDFPWLIYDNPNGENWWRPQSADEGRCFYIALQTGWIRAWHYPFASAPQFKVLISTLTDNTVSYVGYIDQTCLPIEPAALGSIKAIYR